ncbi:hypothetical protein HYX14_01435 [Candidatus Woesearchaeota archaeon]|nr:hypothetical protein [Candidatus Woesearchaeota archaeon]
MAEMKTETLIGMISLISGIISLGLTVYFTNNLPLQIGFAVTLLISVVVFLLYITYTKTEHLGRQYLKMQEDFIQFKDKIEIYSRLARLENKMIKEGDKK